MDPNATPPSTPMHGLMAVELPKAPQKPMVVRVRSEKPSNVARRLDLLETLDDGHINSAMVAAALVVP